MKTILKIKDSVDLKELEKLGFSYVRDGYDYYSYTENTSFIEYEIMIAISSREITVFAYCDDNYECEIDIDIIYDLIASGFVEKIIKKA